MLPKICSSWVVSKYAHISIGRSFKSLLALIIPYGALQQQNFTREEPLSISK